MIRLSAARSTSISFASFARKSPSSGPGCSRARAGRARRRRWSRRGGRSDRCPAASVHPKRVPRRAAAYAAPMADAASELELALADAGGAQAAARVARACACCSTPSSRAGCASSMRRAPATSSPIVVAVAPAATVPCWRLCRWSRSCAPTPARCPTAASPWRPPSWARRGGRIAGPAASSRGPALELGAHGDFLVLVLPGRRAAGGGRVRARRRSTSAAGASTGCARAPCSCPATCSRADDLRAPIGRDAPAAGGGGGDPAGRVAARRGIGGRARGAAAAAARAGRGRWRAPTTIRIRAGA